MGEGMSAEYRDGRLMLAVRADGAKPVELALFEADPVIGDLSGLPAVEAGRRVSLEVSGLPDRAAVTVRMGGEVLAADQYRENGRVYLDLQDTLPFDDMIGVAKLEVLVSTGPQGSRLYHATPLRVILEPGPAADNLIEMSAKVAEYSGILFGNDAVKESDESLDDRLRVLERLSSLYERQYPYFREDPKCRLASAMKRVSIERMRDMTPESVRWMVSHPHEWQRVAPGQGIRMRGASWMPRHALVRTAELSRDLYENRVVAGFPLHLSAEARKMARLLEEAVRVDHGPMDALALGRASAKVVVNDKADELRGYSVVFSRIAALYRDALGVTPEPVNRLPEPARHFIETSQYRLVYELMREWFELEPFEVENLVKRLASVTSLGGLDRQGFRLEESGRHDYKSASALYADNAAAALLNTFVFRKGNETVTLWYQPVLAGGDAKAENGIGLARTTRWSMRPEKSEPVDPLRSTDRPWYSPDFLMALEKNGRTAWAVMDSKYSTVSSVIRHYAVQQAFKYLTSVGTLKKDDVYAGLWLYCGSVSPDSHGEEGSFFNAAPQGGAPVPDMRLERLNALTDSDPAAGLLDRLRSVLV